MLFLFCIYLKLFKTLCDLETWLNGFIQLMKHTHVYIQLGARRKKQGHINLKLDQGSIQNRLEIIKDIKPTTLP